MDKNAIKKYAVWARRELISRVSQRAALYEITESGYGDAAADSVLGRVMSEKEKSQRQALIMQIREKGYQQVIEEVAYIWFNRFVALRFMEVNGYLPSHVRVFTNDAGEFKPQILAEAIHLELEGLDRELVFELESENRSEELFKYLLIVQCNALNSILPGMFQKIDDYTELLLPDYLLREGSVIEQMITMIPEEDWTDQVQIIGWLYQYYISEKKDQVFADLKKNNKISKENIPAATQLFTPDWIVRYMVENSLGRIIIDKRKNEGVFADGRAPEEMTHEEIEKNRIANETYIAEKMGWKYFLPEAEQTPEVREKLTLISGQQNAFDPAALRVIDPCCGSGHILCVLFDVLVQIYEDYGYTAREAAVKIAQNNLYGLDIDDRAAQLAYFSVMMKARQYDRRFFTRNVQPRVYAVQESNQLDRDYVTYFVNNRNDLRQSMESLMTELHDAKEYGSILHVSPVDFDALYARFDEICDEFTLYQQPIMAQLLPFVRSAQALAQKYDVVVTNPPYMGSSGMDAKLSEFVKKNYPDSKSDLFAVFIERCGAFTKPNGYQAMITQHAWMFLSSYEKLRGKLQTVDTVNMAHLGPRAFEEIGGEVVQTTSFVFHNTHTSGYLGTYCRLIEPTTQKGKEAMFLDGKNRYVTSQNTFLDIPSTPIAYWISKQALSSYKEQNLDSVAQPRHGLATSDNDRFLKLWQEVDFTKTSLKNRCDYSKKWFPMSKGGSYRKWYGNLEWIINYENNGRELKDYAISIYRCSTRTIQNTQFYFNEGVTWSALASGGFSVRWQEQGAIFGSGGYCAFVDNEELLMYILALMNSKTTGAFVQFVSPTLNFEVGHIKTIPVLIDVKNREEVIGIVKASIKISRFDWDSFETSWDFKRHPLI